MSAAGSSGLGSASPGTGIAGSASFSGVEAGCIIATVDCVLLVVVVVATDCVVVVVAVAVCCGLLVGVVAGVWAASETGVGTVPGTSGSTVEPWSSVLPGVSSIDPYSAGKA